MAEEQTTPNGSGEGTEARYVAEELRFSSGEDECGATLYMPGSATPGELPCVVMGNGVSLTRVDGLPRFAERFAQAGFAVLTFDFRHLGDSGGEPRQLIDFEQQPEDMAAAVAFARSLDGIDAHRVAVWGYSLGGGVALSVAATDDRLAAGILLCPMVDGLAFALAAGLRNSMYIAGAAMRAVVGRRTAQLPAVGPPGSRAVLTQPEALPNFEALVAASSLWRNEVRAKPSQPGAMFRPVRAAPRVQCPLLVCLGSNDTMVPSRPIERTAERAVRGELRRYPVNHAEAFLDGFDQVARDHVEFLDSHLGSTVA